MHVKTKTGWLCAAMAVVGLLGSVVRGADESYSLMVQQSPAGAGAVSPATGVHKIRMGDHITLQAVAKPGYRFLYWLGDVSDSATNQAVVVIDAPKIVVAVFGRTEYDFAAGGGAAGGEDMTFWSADAAGGGGTWAAGGGAGGSLLTASANYTGGNLGFGGGRPSTPISKARKVLPPSGDTGGRDFPVPDGVPEPATLTLLGAGAILFLRLRRR